MNNEIIESTTNAVIGAWTRGKPFSECFDHIASVVDPLESEIERLRIVVAAYATIEATRKIGKTPPEQCLDAVRDYWMREARAAAACWGYGDGVTMTAEATGGKE